MDARKWFAVLLILTACTSNPTIPPVMPPVPVPPVFSVQSWQSPVGVALSCGGIVPVACGLPPGATWGTFDRPGDQGWGCIDPEPNVCIQVINGRLITAPVNPGFPLISVQTFDRTKTIIVEAIISATCPDPGCWGGIVLYGGDVGPNDDVKLGEWRGIYYSDAGNGQLLLGIWGPTHLKQFPGTFVPNADHLVRLSWHPDGSIEYLVDGVAAIPPETPGSLSNDSTFFTSDPHVAIFSGMECLSVGPLAVYEIP